MNRGMVTMVVLVTLAAAAVAQDVERRREGGRWGGRQRGGPSIAQIIERLNEQLNFTDEQVAQIDEIVAAHEQRMQENRARWREVRAAMEAGDEERAAELREQFRQQRGQRGRAVAAVFDEIEPLLHEDQLEAFQQLRERMAQRRGPGDREHMRQMMRELPDAVNMTDEQREQYEELLNERRGMMRQRMRERWRPEDGGDVERAERRGPPDFAGLQDEFFEQVARILNEDQLKLLADYRARIGEERRRSARRESDDVRTVLSAAKRVRDLSSEQKDSLRDIERDAMRSYRELRRDREGLALLAAEVKAEIVKLLGEEQTEEFKRNLERLQSRGRWGERGGRGQGDRGRPGRDRGDRPQEP